MHMESVTIYIFIRCVDVSALCQHALGKPLLVLKISTKCVIMLGERRNSKLL